MKNKTLFLFSLLYRLAIYANHLFWRFRRSWRAPVPVISVGNVLAGGTGKTPLVQWISSKLIDRGLRPLVVLRGYGSFAGEGDETLLHRKKLSKAVVKSGSNRRKAIESVKENFDIIILDDGFQHRKIYRDLDIVLVDGSRDLRKEHLLPLGLLREPLGSLQRADVVVGTHAKTKKSFLDKSISRYHKKPVTAWCDHVWDSITVFENGNATNHSVEWLSGKKIVVRAGIGQPDYVIKTAKCCGAEIIFVSDAKDHSPFSNKEIEELVQYNSDAILMTEKDHIKFPKDVQKQLRVAVPKLSLRFVEDTESALFQKIEAVLEKGKLFN